MATVQLPDVSWSEVNTVTYSGGLGAANIVQAITGAFNGNIGIDQSNPVSDLSSIDYNSFANYLGSAPDSPTTDNGHLLTFAESSNITFQVAAVRNKNEIYFRYNFAGFQPWQEFYHTGNTGVSAYSDASPTAGTNAINIGDTVGRIGLSRPGTANAVVLEFVNDNGVVGSVRTDGASTQYNVSSDNDLKSVIGKPTDDQINSKFNDIYDCFTLFDWKSGSNTQPVWGFLAWDVIDKGLDFGSERDGGKENRKLSIGDVYQEATYDEDGNELTPELRVTPASVDQSKVVPYLVAKLEMETRKRIAIEQELSAIKAHLGL